MTECDDAVAQLSRIADALQSGGNAELLQKVRLIYQRLGCDDYPVNVPDHLVVQGQAASAQVPQQNLTQLMGWLCSRFIEVLGAYEIKVQVGDNNVVAIPNVSAALSEILLLLSKTNSNRDLGIATHLESAESRQTSIKILNGIESIIKYLGFQVKETPIKVNFSLNPKATSDTNLISPTGVSVPVIQNVDKTTLQDVLHQLLAATAAINKSYKHVDTDQSSKNHVSAKIDAKAALKDNLAKNNDFGLFIRGAEQAFTQRNPGTGKQAKPFGKKLSKSPKIRRLSTKKGSTSKKAGRRGSYFDLDNFIQILSKWGVKASQVSQGILAFSIFPGQKGLSGKNAFTGKGAGKSLSRGGGAHGTGGGGGGTTEGGIGSGESGVTTPATPDVVIRVLEDFVAIYQQQESSGVDMTAFLAIYTEAEGIISNN